MKKTLLIVDDEPDTIKVLRGFLKDRYNILTTDTGGKALEILNNESIDLMLLDLGLPDIDGITVLERMKESSYDTATLVVTGNNDIKTAVKAMQLGACNYILKPPDLEEVRMVVKNILEGRELLNEVEYLRSEVKGRVSGYEGIIGRSSKILEILDTVDKASKTSTNVFITGDSGTGKELIARTIHSKSARKNRPFVAVSCPNLPTELVESELFGHEKGAFTGATQRKTGKFEAANTGTIFLDEIAEISVPIQARLLRVIQEKEFNLVGGTKTNRVDVRITAATNRNIKEEIEKGNFREDLFYRLNVIHISLPPLRQMKEDIPLLVTHFIGQLRKEIHCKIRKFSSRAIEALQCYDWPGNIRELRNVIERVMTLHGESETVYPECLPNEVVQHQVEEKLHSFELSKIKSLDNVVSSVEKDLITQALQQSNGKVAKAARMLNIAPWNLKYKMGKLNIQEEL